MGGSTNNQPAGPSLLRLCWLSSTASLIRPTMRTDEGFDSDGIELALERAENSCECCGKELSRDNSRRGGYGVGGRLTTVVAPLP